MVARSNYFYHLQAIGGNSTASGDSQGFLVDAHSTDQAGRNLVYGYDLENGERDPVSSPDSNVTTYVS